MKIILLSYLLSLFAVGYSQTCDCGKEFSYIESFMRQNYAGYKDKVANITLAKYNQYVDQLKGQLKGPHTNERCLLIISQFLSQFKDEHVRITTAFAATQADTAFATGKEIVKLTDAKLEELKKSTSAEGIYIFKHDSSYKIAVIKTKDPLADYMGIIVSSKLPGWQPGMIKFMGKHVNDSLLKGALFLRNFLPKEEWFSLGKNRIGGDWQREGTQSEPFVDSYVPVAANKLNAKTFYLKISSFSPSNGKRIDSIFTTYKALLDTTPNWVLDLRGNGGGTDFSYQPILPYLYTNPVHYIGSDVLATAANIKSWEKELEDNDLSESNRRSIENTISQMKKHIGQQVRLSGDGIDSSGTILKYPQKVIVLIDKGCASSTEQFLLVARESKKVILLGQPTAGVLDYSNSRSMPFSCMPYNLWYATSRSRRVDFNQGIDNKGIQPNRVIGNNIDWIKEALKILE